MESNKTISVRDLMITGSLVFSVLGNLYANVVCGSSGKFIVIRP